MKSAIGVCAFALCAANAFAAPTDTIFSGTASLANLTYRLVDLDPTDGIAPSITFSSNGLAPGGISAHNGSYTSQSLLGNGLFLTSKTTAVSPDRYAQASVSGAANASSSAKLNLDETSAFIATASLNDPAILRTAYVEKYAGPTTWKLSANTELIIEGYASTTLSSDVSKLQVDPSVFRYAGATQYNLVGQSRAAVQLNFLNSYQVGDYAGYSHDEQVTYVITKEGVSETRSAQDVSEAFQLSLRNDTSSARAGAFSYSALSYVYANMSFVQTIPEPGTWALMGLGLVGVAAASRRARRA